MRFILATGWEDGVAGLTQRLVSALAEGKRVLWLVSGGSNIDAAVDVMDTITPRLSQGLSILLADERFGQEGHSDSNWTNLMKAGFKPKRALLLPVLCGKNTLEEALAHYRDIVRKAYAEHDVIVVQLGMGVDGHIAGILPNSAAAKEKKELVVSYKSNPYTRLTLTFPALKRAHHAYVFAFGDTKAQALFDLHNKRLSLLKQPAQILKRLQDVSVYNDQLGDD
ncbi:MAG TPA: 6-phosphogluconolactonase [Verrucomicrobiae bacterium]|nr:6-phosphogluconolactonase [Verrucomicrobiae bacterium]